MKIEKISENQIRCTLSHQDLVDRELKISELAYGTEKAKALFRDMMQQASFEFGFEAEDIPIMIEAIPISRETLILVITKVDDPDELDSRFSNFSPDSSEEDNEKYYEDEDPSDLAEEILNRYEELTDILDVESEDIEDTDETEEEDSKAIEDNVSAKDVTEEKEPSTQDIIKIYSFPSLEEITKVSLVLHNSYLGQNSVYKDSSSMKYYLIIHKSNHLAEEFNRICSIISEYGQLERSTYATSHHFNEHFTPIIQNQAIQILQTI